MTTGLLTSQTAARSLAGDSTGAADPGVRFAQFDNFEDELDFILSVEALRNLDPYFNYTGDFGSWSIRGMHEPVGTATWEAQTRAYVTTNTVTEEDSSSGVSVIGNAWRELAADALNFSPQHTHVDRDYFIV